MILETLENLRREAYVRAVIRADEFDNVVGYVGEDLPVEIFYAANLTPYPLYGIDREILNFSVEKNLCPLIDATITYAKTDKCPLIHSSKLIVVGKTCNSMARELLSLENKNIYVYEGEENLIAELKKFYDFNEILSSITLIKRELEKISDYIEELKRGFNLSDLQGFVIKYFINFLDIDERENFLAGLTAEELKNFDAAHEFVDLIFSCPKCKKFLTPTS